MEFKEIYEYLDKIVFLSFSTIYNDEVHSRIAHFNGYDEEGFYFRTMVNKPYGRQLKEGGKITVCGNYGGKLLNHEDIGAIPEMAPGFSIRLIGDIRYVEPEIIKEKAKSNKYLELAARDIDLYPAMAKGNFVLYRAKGEVYDYDYGKINRDHKLLRTRFAFGGATYNEAGPRISEHCTSCGICLEGCTFDAIIEGEPYKINPIKCDDCGSCIINCPVGAIEESLVF